MRGRRRVLVADAVRDPARARRGDAALGRDPRERRDPHGAAVARREQRARPGVRGGLGVDRGPRIPAVAEAEPLPQARGERLPPVRVRAAAGRDVDDVVAVAVEERELGRDALDGDELPLPARLVAARRPQAEAHDVLRSERALLLDLGPDVCSLTERDALLAVARPRAATERGDDDGAGEGGSHEERAGPGQAVDAAKYGAAPGRHRPPRRELSPE
jgi:hypothetical protein